MSDVRPWLTAALVAWLAALAPAGQAASDRTTRSAAAAAAKEEAAAQSEGAKLVPQVAHAGGPSVARFSPDGTRVVTVGDDRTAAVWDVDTGVLLHRLIGHTAIVVAAEFSPNGKRVVTASRDGTAILWDPFTGRSIRTFDNTSGLLENAHFSPDGSRVVTTARDNAAVWDTESGKLLFELTGHKGRVHDASFSPNGNRLVMFGDDHKPSIWNLETGKRVQRLAVHTDDITQAIYAPEGKRVVTAGADGLTAVWDPVFPQVLYRLSTPIDELDEERGLDTIKRVHLNADATRAVTLRADGAAVVWDLTSGKELRTFEKIWSSAEFSPDGLNLLTSGNGTVLWSVETGEIVRTLSSNFSLGASFSPDGSHILALVQIPGGTAADLFDAATGERLERLGGRVGPVSAATFSPDGAEILTAGRDQFASVWDLDTGEIARRFEGRGSFEGAAFSRDGARIVTADKAFGANVWDLATGAPVRDTDGAGKRAVSDAAFLDADTVLAVGAGRAWLLAAATGKIEHTLDGNDVVAAAGAPDASAVYTTSRYRGSVTVWDPASGKSKRKLHGLEPGPMDQLAVSPDGRLIAVNDEENSVALYDVVAKAVVKRLSHPGSVTSVGFSPGGDYVVTATRGGTALVWNARTGEQYRRLRGECGTVFSATFSPDGKRVLTACVDGSSRLWDLETGTEQVALLSFTDGTWAVVDKEGRFDASNDGDIAGLVWVIDDESYELSQLRAQYYDPGLLAKVLQLKDEPLREVPPLSSIRPPPKITIEGPDQKGRVVITLTDRGGGIGDLFVTLNGSDISKTVAKRCPKLADGEPCIVELAKMPTWRKGSANEVEAFAEIRSGNVRSRGTVREVQAEGTASTDPPDLWVLSIGVSDYTGDRIDLTYPAKDALRFAEAMRIAGEDGFGSDRVHVRTYTTSPTDPGVTGRPTRDTLNTAAAWMAGSDPGDTIVVFMAGHGVSLSVNSVDDYFYLLPDAGTTDDVVNAQLRALRAWSGDQIADALAKIPALKRVVILDTCAAGKLDVTSLSAERDLSSDAIRAHARAQERTGAWFLAGAAADKVSYEASRYAQGVLTYSLLEGMRGPALGEGDLLYVSRLFQYAIDKVPEYAAGIGGIQKPVARSGNASDFVIGLLSPTDRTRIPIERVRPVVVRASVVAQGGRPDSLGLASAINRNLRDRAAGRDASLVYWDTDASVDAWQVSGQYQALEASTGLAFTGFVTRTVDGKVEEIQLSARGADVEATAKAIVDQVIANVK